MQVFTRRKVLARDLQRAQVLRRRHAVLHQGFALFIARHQRSRLVIVHSLLALGVDVRSRRHSAIGGQQHLCVLPVDDGRVCDFLVGPVVAAY